MTLLAWVYIDSLPISVASSGIRKRPDGQYY